jgi:hypothetical protein
MNTQSSGNTIMNAAFLLAGTASIGSMGIARLPPMPAAMHTIAYGSSHASHIGSNVNPISLSAIEEREPIIPMATIKKIRIKVSKSEKLEILPS